MSNAFDQDLLTAAPALRRYALSLCRRGDLADDLVQTCFEKALAARAQYDPAQRLEPWLFRILRNAWLDMARRTQTRGVEIDVTETQDAAIHDGPRTTEAILMLRKTETAMNDLPDDQREVLHLVCFQELSYAEAAETLGIPRGTVMSRLARARIALAKKLGINH
jgi:RNA polymerase sigma-70 factor (ECF subfamily)